MLGAVTGGPGHSPTPAPALAGNPLPTSQETYLRFNWGPPGHRFSNKRTPMAAFTRPQEQRLTRGVRFQLQEKYEDRKKKILGKTHVRFSMFGCTLRGQEHIRGPHLCPRTVRHPGGDLVAARRDSCRPSPSLAPAALGRLHRSARRVPCAPGMGWSDPSAWKGALETSAPQKGARKPEASPSG